MLSLKQQKFCEYYVQSGNATEAAIKAGYSEKSARVTASKMLTFANIQKYIDELKNVSQSERIASATEILEFFTSVMKDNSAALKDRIKAAENLAKRYALDKPTEESEEQGGGQPAFEFVFKDMTMKDENGS